MDLQSRKILFIQEFLKLQNEEVVKYLEEVLHQKKNEDTIKDEAKANKAVSKDLDIWAAIKPIKKSYSIEEMIKDQNYQPIEKDAFYKKVKALNITEPLEELLSQLD